MPDQRQAEQALVQRAQAGEAEAVVALYQRHAQAIFRYFALRTRDRSTAEDLAGEVFTRMVSGLPRYQDRGAPFAAWLFRIAHDRLVDHVRRAARRPVADLPEALPDPAPGPEAQALDRLEIRRLKAAMAHLTEEQQMVVQLRFVEELDLEETAAALGKSVGAVKSMQHRALASLARLLREQ